jgi:hypothetical protein
MPQTKAGIYRKNTTTAIAEFEPLANGSTLAPACQMQSPLVGASDNFGQGRGLEK